MLIKIEDFQILLSRKRIKNLNLRINHQGEIKLSVPLRCPMTTISDFLHTKRDWILAHQSRLQNKLLQQSAFPQEEYHFLLGKLYPIKTVEYTPKQLVEWKEDHLCCYLKTRAKPGIQKKMLHIFQRQYMESLLPDLIRKWEPVIGVTVNDWTIKTMKSRWGSCHPIKKRICMNLNLIQKPLGCLEYVLVHEMVHLLEASHNRRFYDLMSRFLPNWKQYKQDLEGL